MVDVGFGTVLARKSSQIGRWATPLTWMRYTLANEKKQLVTIRTAVARGVEASRGPIAPPGMRRGVLGRPAPPRPGVHGNMQNRCLVHPPRVARKLFTPLHAS